MLYPSLVLYILYIAICAGMWCNYKQLSVSRMRIAYNNAFRILMKLPKKKTVVPVKCLLTEELIRFMPSYGIKCILLCFVFLKVKILL